MSSRQEALRKIESIVRPDAGPYWGKTMSAMAAEAVERVESPVILDIGCGLQSWVLVGTLITNGLRIGLDVDPEAVKNEHVDQVILASADHIPLDDESVDLIISTCVIEHLPYPKKTLQEFHRVLKPGGSVVLSTSNKWNYAMIISSLTPTRFHNLVRKAAAITEDKDNCRTYYRLNNPGKLRKGLIEAGLKPVGKTVYGATAYTYFGCSKILYALAAAGSHLISLTPLRCLKSIIIIRAVKV